MIGSLREFCLRHRVHFEEEPQLLHSSHRTWLIRDVLGKQWVIKSKEPEDPTTELLTNFSVLHPPFHYPRPVSEPDDPYVLYPYLQGELLAHDGFENPEVIEKVMDLIGRVQATMRSLALVPSYQETMKLKDRDPLENPLERLSFDRTQGTSEQQRAARRREMAESYHWTERNVEACRDALQAHGLWAGAPFDEYRERVHNLFALHIPVVGSNLSHTALHPEHLVASPDGQLGIVGWKIEPRPRFYMIYTYLAWSFFRSRKQDAWEFYREYLMRNSSRAFHTEHHLVFALCLMEQLAHRCGQTSAEALSNAAQRIDEANRLFIECVEKARKDDEAF
jgi:hypothetical protein